MNTTIIVLAIWAFIAVPLVIVTFRYVERCLNRWKLGTRNNNVNKCK